MQQGLDTIAGEVTKTLTVVGLLLMGLRYAVQRGEKAETDKEALHGKLLELHIKSIESQDRVADAIDRNTTAVAQLDQTVRELKGAFGTRRD